MTTMIRNVGGQGSLSLITSSFFEWATNLTRTVVNELTVWDIVQKPHIAEQVAVRRLLNNAVLRLDFAQAATKHSKSSHLTAIKVYEEVVTKVKNARFAETRRSYSTKHVAAKGKGTSDFRTEQLVLVMTRNSKSGSMQSLKTKTQASSVSADSASSSSDAPVESSDSNTALGSVILSPGQNEAVNDKWFLLVGSFSEVSSDKDAATLAVKNMLESFGAKGLSRFSKKTSKYSLICNQPPTVL